MSLGGGAPWSFNRLGGLSGRSNRNVRSSQRRYKKTNWQQLRKEFRRYIEMENRKGNHYKPDGRNFKYWLRHVKKVS